MLSVALVFTSLILLLAGPVLAQDGNVLFHQMLKDGLSLTDDVTAPLPAPTFLGSSNDTLPPSEVEKRLQKLARAGGVKRFVRNSAVAPIAIDTDSISNSEGQRIGHLLDVTFIVHAPLDWVQDSDALNSLLGVDPSADETEDAGAASQVSPEELAKLGIAPTAETESFGRISFPLLDRVMVEGVIHAETQRHIEGAPGDFVTVAWHLDPRFENSWSPIERDDLGKETTGDAKPYRGLGGLITATRLPAEIAGTNSEATIVQARFVVHEPVDWFGGRNQLRSKLPLIIQDRVRDLRRKLADSHTPSR
ncbi:putative signal peptide protein [Rhodopirellula islandica]|uniref:Signal peptide protein n=1 Tax=Rhodopirellula islandica TaxID=595434 RepID=A0A0J1B355_RHOIS|nr:putative signal peptide protein [Rhodopirellula islandica]